MEKGCIGKAPKACEALGSIYSTGQDVKHDNVKAKEYYLTAANLDKMYCDDDGNTLSCYWLASLYRDGLGVEQNNTLAKHYFKKSCEKGDPSACEELAKVANKENK